MTTSYSKERADKPAAIHTYSEELFASHPIEFACASEQEFAHFDARDIAWQYKPRTFAVEWDEEATS
jgi:hypothetical protein